jgi:hypothetical protein
MCSPLSFRYSSSSAARVHGIEVGDRDLSLSCYLADLLRGKVWVEAEYYEDLPLEQVPANELGGLMLESRTDEWESQRQTEFHCLERHLI